MSIVDYYTTQVEVKRLAQVGATDKETYQTHIASLNCRIEAEGSEPVMFEDGSTYNLFTMWCGSVDIKEGDRIMSGSTTYTVRGISIFNKVAQSHHMEISLALPR